LFFYELSRSNELFDPVNFELFLKMINELKMDLLKEENENKQSFTSNSIAGQSIIKIFLSFKSKYQNKEINFDQVFKDHINENILFILNSNEPALLDCGTQCLSLLLNFEISFINVIY
jgi:hypothetical protein